MKTHVIYKAEEGFIFTTTENYFLHQMPQHNQYYFFEDFESAEEVLEYILYHTYLDAEQIEIIESED